jgi:hypothetical protein
MMIKMMADRIYRILLGMLGTANLGWAVTRRDQGTIGGTDE